MSKIRCQTAKLIPLMDVLDVLQEKECEAFEITGVPRGAKYTLPDGSDSIRTRVWRLLNEHNYGNQRFCNDTVFIYCFGESNESETGVYDEGELGDTERVLYEVCKDHLTVNSCTCIAYFDVCW